MILIYLLSGIGGYLVSGIFDATSLSVSHIHCVLCVSECVVYNVCFVLCVCVGRRVRESLWPVWCSTCGVVTRMALG